MTLPEKKGLRVPMRVFAKFAKETQLQVRCTLKTLDAGDVVEIKLNGRKIESWQRPEAGVLVASIDAMMLRYGENQFELRLARKSPKVVTPRIVTALELHVEKR